MSTSFHPPPPQAVSLGSGFVELSQGSHEQRLRLLGRFKFSCQYRGVFSLFGGHRLSCLELRRHPGKLRLRGRPRLRNIVVVLG